MQSLTQASLLNTRASQFLELGNFEASFQHYRAAIRELAQGSHQSDLPAGKNDTVSMLRPSSLSLYQRAELPSNNHTKSNLLNCVFVFTSSSPEDLDQQLTIEHLALYSAILIFNCAVCLHRKGCDKALHKASNLYMQCLELLDSISSFIECSDILAAVLRNQADICYTNGDFYNVRYLLDKLFLLSQMQRLPPLPVDDNDLTHAMTAPEA